MEIKGAEMGMSHQNLCKFTDIACNIECFLIYKDFIFILINLSSSLKQTMLLHMCFERFLLAFESRDLSQADKRITRVSSFPSFNF